MRVFFDASIIIAALLSPSGGSSLLFEYVKQERIVGLTSQTVIDEILEEEKYKKLNKSRNEIVQFVAQSGLIIREAIGIEEISSLQGQVDLDDAHLIAGAVQTKSAYLVTLDKKHLLREDIRQKFLPLRILSPKELLQKLVNK
ncbi:MAG: putative toxin-antitoxin system toxin component, PIN family [Candidatus Levybacteria bacterium]|nr:putative toxin-antitoxin system toxin component, PIN family [Candidatus Levybacteria bacterium]